MAEQRFEQLLRSPFEAYASIGWAIAAVWMTLCAVILNAPKTTMMATAGMAALFVGIRYLTARKLLNYKLALAGKPVRVITTTEFKKSIPKNPKHLWLGWGYRWEPRHTQRAYEIMKRNLDDVYPPSWWLRWEGIPEKDDPRRAKGLPWVHGLDMKEKEIKLSFESLKGHCAIVATTGAIKTRLAALIIFQLALRGDTVIVIDPKGDKDLREICRQAAEMAGKPERFSMMHPAFASESVRLDLLKNWDQVSQVASRIKLVLGSQESNNFMEFCWMAVHQITNGMKYVGKRVNLYNLKNSMVSRASVERLTEEVLRKFFKEECPQLLEAIEKEVNASNSAGRRPPNKNMVETGSAELSAMIKVFQSEVPELSDIAYQKGMPVKPDEIRGLVTILEQNKEWFGKMIVSITPLLTKLTTDDLKSLLSPDYEDDDDLRPILDAKKLVDAQHIFYMGTDTLADESVGKAMSTMLLADLSSVAAEIYNHGGAGDDGGRLRGPAAPEEPLAHPGRRVCLVDDAVRHPQSEDVHAGGDDVDVTATLGETAPDLSRLMATGVRARRAAGCAAPLPAHAQRPA
jgi:conjugal transfer pilus assembly protein TraD